MPALGDTRTDQLSDGLYKDILVGIMMGDFPSLGALPSEPTLAKDYGVSRATVRKALKQLKDEGLVISRQGSGTVVTEAAPSRIALTKRNRYFQELNDCLACRLAIEPEIAAMVAERPTNAAIDYLRAQLSDLERETGPMEEPENARSANDARFHIRLAELSGNKHFAAIMSDLQPHILFAMNIAKLLPGPDRRTHMDESMKEHLAIVKSILDSDPASARSMMRMHIANARQRVFARLDVSEPA